LLGSALVGKRLRKTESLDPLANAQTSLTRLRQRAMATLEYLEKRKGAEPAISLPLLVQELCELWQRETGSRVTGDCVGYRRNRISEAGNIHKGRITAAGQFILDFVEAFHPIGPASDTRPNPARAKILLAESSDRRVRIIHRAILAHIAGRPRKTKRGRPRVQ
jgi:F420-0:gamma-glutamyl ligase-like protein